MLNPMRLALAGGILWGAFMFIFTLAAYFTGYGQACLEMMSSVYIGYSISLIGSVLGMIWGFVDAFIFLYLLAWLYNKLNVAS